MFSGHPSWHLAIVHPVSVVIFSVFLSHLLHHCQALKSLICADVPLRNNSLTHSVLSEGISMKHAKNIHVSEIAENVVKVMT